MIVVMESGASDQTVEAVIGFLVSAGFDVHRSSGVARTILGVVGDVTQNDVAVVSELEGVAQVVRVSEPYRLASRRFRQRGTNVEGPWGTIGGERPWVAIEPVGDGGRSAPGDETVRPVATFRTRSPPVGRSTRRSRARTSLPRASARSLACRCTRSRRASAFPVRFIERRAERGRQRLDRSRRARARARRVPGRAARSGRRVPERRAHARSRGHRARQTAHAFADRRGRADHRRALALRRCGGVRGGRGGSGRRHLAHLGRARRRNCARSGDACAGATRSSSRSACARLALRFGDERGHRRARPDRWLGRARAARRARERGNHRRGPSQRARERRGEAPLDAARSTRPTRPRWMRRSRAQTSSCSPLPCASSSTSCRRALARGGARDRLRLDEAQHRPRRRRAAAARTLRSRSPDGGSARGRRRARAARSVSRSALAPLLPRRAIPTPPRRRGARASLRGATRDVRRSTSTTGPSRARVTRRSSSRARSPSPLRRAHAERAAGPAFEGATRSAGGPEAIWSDILETNADEVASALDGHHR